MAGHLDLIWYAAEWAIRIGALLVVPLRRMPSASIVTGQPLAPTPRKPGFGA